jgi:hypothetical protein
MISLIALIAQHQEDKKWKWNETKTPQKNLETKANNK